MNKIKLLPKDIAEKIAAGEVIQRPASVVKELVENSVDANSTTIQILFTEGGKQNISVIDNGLGIAGPDLKLALQSHATSKITDIDDLLRLTSLGFRGEALASIASVAKMKLISRTPDDIAGNMIEVHAGEEINFGPIGTPPGTRIEVNDLFYNIPARKKFLKTKNIEASHIVEQICHLSLAYPNIRFQVSHEQNEVLKTSGKNDVLKAWGDLFGHNQAQKFFHLPKTKGELIEVELFLGSPEIAKSTTKGIFMFVNNRPFSSKPILSSLISAYKEYIPHKRLPQALLYLTINPIHIDVNVHPAKKEVSFSNPEMIKKQIHGLALDLLNNSLSRKINIPLSINPRGISDTRTSSPQAQPLQIKETPLVENIFPAIDPTQEFSLPKITDQTNIEKSAYPTQSQFNNTILSSLGPITFITQFYNSFIFVETRDNLIMIDQHAAHERINFNKVLADFKNKKMTSQPLLTPIVINLNPVENEAKGEIIKYLVSLSFQLEDFGANSLILREIPGYIRDKEKSLSICKELIEDYLANFKNKEPQDILFHSLTTIACHASIKAGEKLSFAEMNSLIRQLFATDNNSTCPHGRPITKTISYKELNSYFAR